jgi:transcriptional regulator with XRE-family HTH domain
MSVEELASFETGAAKPSLTKFEKIAAAYKMPLSTLFRRTPPAVPAELPDFRTIEGIAAKVTLAWRRRTVRQCDFLDRKR